MLSKSEIESVENAVIYYGDDFSRTSWERIKMFLEEFPQQPLIQVKTPAAPTPEGEIKRDCLTCRRKRYGTCDPVFCDAGFSGWIPA